MIRNIDSIIDSSFEVLAVFFFFVWDTQLVSFSLANLRHQKLRRFPPNLALERCSTWSASGRAAAGEPEEEEALASVASVAPVAWKGHRCRSPETA